MGGMLLFCFLCWNSHHHLKCVTLHMNEQYDSKHMPGDDHGHDHDHSHTSEDIIVEGQCTIIVDTADDDGKIYLLDNTRATLFSTNITLFTI